ncbi:vanadium-dependent haloperoxidase [Nonomuraea sp. NPDC004580]|uniref:vanadium-dependent haloperoxidase n=1 Tax=Nonomuraea sp. NPDC004580 TaxID=3154552 RepID=UPI0033A1FB9E
MVVRWNQALLQAVRTGTLGPPMVARALAVAHTCAYDAWAAYDPVAVGTRLGGSLRRPPAERTTAAKTEAISYAAHLAAVDLYPGQRAVFDALMADLGFDPADSSSRPARTGLAACQAVLDHRHADGSNQAGGYADTSGYAPVKSDGPSSETPPGHWCLFAQQVSARDRLGLDQDVKLFFALANSVMDAGIASWEVKRDRDSARPITAIRFLYQGQRIPTWGGRTVDGASWVPYQPPTFPTPPFGEYVSGHSTFSAAAAEVLKRFTGSDAFGGLAVVAAGSSPVEPGVTPASDVTLRWSTFSAAAEEAGLSRRYGGIHFKAGDLEGRALGRAVGTAAWERAKAY